jgi:tetratricopeptide (TPR) repeat protein
MKKLMTLVLLLAITSMSFAQKSEVKEIEKAIKNSNFANAKSAVSAAEALIGNMDDKTKAKFYFLKAQALYANGAGTDANVDEAIATLDKLKDLESSMGKLKYTEEANEMKSQMFNSFITKANNAFNNKDYKTAAKRFEKVYRVSPTDTTYLFNAAYSAVEDQDYDTALDYFIELKDLGYTGVKMNYYATDKETGEEVPFADKAGRDLSVKTLKTHIKPRDAKSPSRRAEIVKNIAIIYVTKGENEKALSAIQDAKEDNPNDYNLILSEGNVYLQLGNTEKAAELYKEALSMDPENPDLNYNVGVLAMEAKQYDYAEEAFQKTLTYKPSYSDAALNLSAMEINKGNALNDEMNSLGTSSADNKRYDELRAKKNEHFQKAAEHLEDFVEKNPNTKNLDILGQLKNIYSALGETEKYKEMKAKVEEVEAMGGGN